MCNVPIDTPEQIMFPAPISLNTLSPKQSLTQPPFQPQSLMVLSSTPERFVWVEVCVEGGGRYIYEFV